MHICRREGLYSHIACFVCVWFAYYRDVDRQAHHIYVTCAERACLRYRRTPHAHRHTHTLGCSFNDSPQTWRQHCILKYSLRSPKCISHTYGPIESAGKWNCDYMYIPNICMLCNVHLKPVTWRHSHPRSVW